MPINRSVVLAKLKFATVVLCLCEYCAGGREAAHWPGQSCQRLRLIERWVGETVKRDNVPRGHGTELRDMEGSASALARVYAYSSGS